MELTGGGKSLWPVPTSAWASIIMRWNVAHTHAMVADVGSEPYKASGAVVCMVA